MYEDRELSLLLRPTTYGMVQQEIPPEPEPLVVGKAMARGVPRASSTTSKSSPLGNFHFPRKTAAY